MKVFVEFSGGLDICFNGSKEFEVEFTENTITAKLLIQRLGQMCNQKKLDMFLQADQIRPGILVLINDADWELESKEEAVLSNSDRVSFISTLHGG